MQARDAVFLEDLCPKMRARTWRRSLHQVTGGHCLYCGRPSESIDHVHPLSRGGLSTTENCVPACLACNGAKGDADAFDWYRRQSFYDPRRAMALRAWVAGDLRLALRLLEWSLPAAARNTGADPENAGAETGAIQAPPATRSPAHQTRQAAAPLWRWQMAS